MRICLGKVWFLAAIALIAPTRAQVSMVASSEFQPALEELRKAFTAQSGVPTRVVYGSTGAMAEAAKSPGVDLFLSASRGTADSIASSPRADEGAMVIASIPVAVWVRGSKVQPEHQLRHLDRPRLGRVAIADTLHSPDGRKAVDALHNLPNWPDIRKKLLVLGNPQLVVDSAMAAPLLAEESDSASVDSGKVDTAHKDSGKVAKKDAKPAKPKVAEILPVTDAFLPQPLLWNTAIAGQGRWVALDPSLATPLLPTVVRLKSVNPTRAEATRNFLQFLQSPKGRSILAARGFLAAP